MLKCHRMLILIWEQISQFGRLQIVKFQVNLRNLKVGNRVFFNDHCSIHITEEITVGHDTMFRGWSTNFDSNHQFNNYHVFKTAIGSAPVHIGQDCWIGANTVILEGSYYW